MPLKQRVPKLKGFNNPFRVEYQAINLDTLGELADAVGGRIDPQALVDHGLAPQGRLRQGPRPRRADRPSSTSTPTPCRRPPRRRSPPRAVR